MDQDESEGEQLCSECSLSKDSLVTDDYLVICAHDKLAWVRNAT